MYGYDRLPTTVPGGLQRAGHQQPRLPFLDHVRGVLTGVGLHAVPHVQL